MHKLKHKAVQLRREGKSYLQIQQVLGVAKSTLSLWLREIKLSDELTQKIYSRGKQKSIEALIKRNKEQTVIAKEKALKIRGTFSKDIGQITKEKLFYLGLALYIGEGYKRGSEGAAWKCVDVANSDPDVIRIMMRFFRECCDVEDKNFRIYLSLHDKKSEEMAIDYWVRQTGLKKENFIKTSFAQASSTKYKYPRRLVYGTIHIRIYNTELFHQIIGWIDGVRKMV